MHLNISRQIINMPISLQELAVGNVLTLLTPVTSGLVLRRPGRLEKMFSEKFVPFRSSLWVVAFNVELRLVKTESEHLICCDSTMIARHNDVQHLIMSYPCRTHAILVPPIHRHSWKPCPCWRHSLGPCRCHGVYYSSWEGLLRAVFASWVKCVDMKCDEYTLQEICAMSSQDASRLLDSRRIFGTDVFRPQVLKAFGRHGGGCRGSALPNCGWLLGRQES